MTAAARARLRRHNAQLAWVSLGCGLGLAAMYALVADLRERGAYLVGLLVSYAAFTWLVQRLAERAAGRSNPVALLNFTMALTFAKMLFGIALVYGYYRAVRPPTLHFLLPFAWCYLGFTVFETWALVRLSFATSPKPAPEP